jgi:FkbM family methyltransferase
MNLSELASKLELAAIHRMPFPIQSAYVPTLKQVVAFPKLLSSSYNEIFIKKTYQPLAPLPAKAVVADLGTNLGVFAMYINAMVRGSAIYCFEANPKLFPYLKVNLDRMPDRGNDIKVFNIAIANKAGTIEFTMDHANIASLASTAFRDTSWFPDAANYRPVKVPCQRLDSFVSSKIDFLKCDIEGAEYAVLEETLLSGDRVGQAVIEFHDVSERLGEFCRIIESALSKQFVIHLPEYGEIKSPEQIEKRLNLERGDAVLVKMCSPGAREAA